MDYFEEEEQYMHDMNNAQIEEEYNRLAAMQAMIQNEIDEKQSEGETHSEERE